MARWGVVFALAGASLAGCAAILGREAIVLDADGLDADGATDDRTAADVVLPDDVDTPPTDGGSDAGPDAPTCPGVDSGCTNDSGTACCPGMECRNQRCNLCAPLDGSCSGGMRCCGPTLRCDTRIFKCIECLEAGTQCPITEANICCGGNCSPVNGCF